MTIAEMKQIDPATVDRPTLVNVADIHIDDSLSREEQLVSYLAQIKNPYLFLCGNIMVELAFSDTTQTLEDVTEHYIRARQKQEYMKF